MPEALIDAATLRNRLDEHTPTVILDVRWKLGDDRGHEHYVDGHIPGALYADINQDLAAPASAAAGRHALPAIDDLTQSLQRWGIHPDSTVVVYDDNASQSAARAWWLLRWAGIGDVRVLDGGLSAWRDAGNRLETGEQTAADTGTATAVAGALPTWDIDAVARRGPDVLLVDARAGERYRGETEPVDPRPGHIPGALSAPTADNVDADGRFLPADRLRSRFTGLGIGDAKEVVVYCGSGVTAAHELLALELAGFEAALFPGSWSQWSADAERPAAVGENPR
ncbi:sulfurtransferase [Gordonia sp. DT30]|uniref:sulfurtransferase n=1 Tax=Gordonia sp. DT30 TaxID=3416546 RepID=UPI003CE86CE4